MKNRIRHFLITFLIVTLAGLGGARADVGSCSADCVLCVPAAAVSCCSATPSAGHGDMVSVKPAPNSSAADCPHGEFCSVMSNYPADAGIISSNLFDDTVLLTTAPVFLEQPLVSYLQPDELPYQPPDAGFGPLYIRNCCYLI